MKKINIPFKFEKKYIPHFVIALLFVWCFVLCFKVHTARMEAKKVQYTYVYNAELLSANYSELVTLQQNYQQQIQALTAQLEEIKAKIEKVSDKDTKKEISDAYLAQITEKRNNLVASYQQSLQVLTAKANKALEEVAVEKGAPVVFNATSIVVRTPYVIDITADVAEKLK